MSQVEIQRIAALPSQILLLEKEAVAEGFRFLTRLIDEWEAGVNRFEAPGECLMAVFLEGCLVGIGGLSRDPFAQQDVGRLRRLYIAETARRQDVGSTLVEHLVQYAAQHFRVVRLSTDTLSGAAFYLRCGFRPLDDDHATHIRLLNNV